MNDPYEIIKVEGAISVKKLQYESLCKIIEMHTKKQSRIPDYQVQAAIIEARALESIIKFSSESMKYSMLRKSKAEGKTSLLKDYYELQTRVFEAEKGYLLKLVQVEFIMLCPSKFSPDNIVYDLEFKSKTFEPIMRCGILSIESIPDTDIETQNLKLEKKIDFQSKGSKCLYNYILGTVEAELVGLGDNVRSQKDLIIDRLKRQFEIFQTINNYALSILYSETSANTEENYRILRLLQA